MSTADVSSRYLIYSLLRRFVDIHDHAGKKTSGVVRRVYRNVMDGVVELNLGGKQFSFTEPTSISLQGNEVIFIYGSAGSDEDSDEALFREARLASHCGESMDDVLRRTEPTLRKETRFKLGPKLSSSSRYARA